MLPYQYKKIWYNGGMKKNVWRRGAWVWVAALALMIVAAAFAVFVMQNGALDRLEDSQADVDLESHVVVLGTYENQLFLERVCSGASNVAGDYKASVEFYVPETLAKDMPLQKLFDYAAYVNADGIIAYISSPSEAVRSVVDIDGREIPVVTTGVFAANCQQVSYVGTSYWELGRIIGEETRAVLNGKGTAFLVTSESPNTNNFSNLTNSIQACFNRRTSISSVFRTSISEEDIRVIRENPETDYAILCLSEEDTLRFCQFKTEQHLGMMDNLKAVCFGSSEACRAYLAKGVIDELVSLDLEKIGETAMKEIFEYERYGYANSYIAADMKVERFQE